MSRAVLDASAVLAFLFGEPGAAGVEDKIDGGAISALNYAEALARLIERGADIERARRRLAPLNLDIVPFGAAEAEATARLRAPTRHLGLSLADRACLALARARGAPAYTTDRAWGKARHLAEIVVLG